MRRTPRSALLFALGAGLTAAGCDGGPQEVAFVEPSRHAFVRDDGPVEVRVRVLRQDELRLSVDGAPVAPAPVRGEDGVFRAALALPVGRHRLVAEAPGVPGAADERVAYVGRAPHAPVDGFAFAPGATHAMTLSDGRAGEGGLFEGRLAVFAIGTAGTGLYRELSGNGVTGQMSEAGRVSWIDDWNGTHGTLHLAALDGPEAFSLPRVRESSFAPDGVTLGALDDGVLVRTAAGVSRRIASSSRAFVFSGPAGDVVSFDGESGEDARTVTLAAAPDYAVSTVLATPVLPVVASNPVRREVAFLEWRAGEYGPLVLYEHETTAVSRPFESVAGLTWSRDGVWLLALADAVGTEASLGLLRRDVPAVPLVLPGAFRKAVFDRGSRRVFALEAAETGRLRVAHLDDPVPALEDVMTGVEELAALPGDRMLILTTDGEIAVVDADDSVLELGPYNLEAGDISHSRDGSLLAFTALAGDLRPIRRVDFETGHIGDLGLDARRPVVLAGGALAWAEAVPGDEEREELWLFPRFPGSFGGARRVKTDIDVGRPFPPSPDGERVSVVAGGRTHCVDADAQVADLGPVDDARHDSFFLVDGRLARFGVDGDQSRVLFLQHCD